MVNATPAAQSSDLHVFRQCFSLCIRKHKESPLNPV
jgi:hypothetical protein